jgi:circadian clock protein KaiC
MFLDNISRHLGDDYASLFGSRCSFLDLITLRGEGLSAVLETILSEIKHYKASRLVIDSFTAIAQAFERPIDARIAIHTLIRRLVRELGCTTLLISETPFGEERIGLGMEEFVADGVILLKMGELEDRFFREIEVRKMRG